MFYGLPTAKNKRLNLGIDPASDFKIEQVMHRHFVRGTVAAIFPHMLMMVVIFFSGLFARNSIHAVQVFVVMCLCNQLWRYFWVRPMARKDTNLSLRQKNIYDASILFDGFFMGIIFYVIFSEVGFSSAYAMFDILAVLAFAVSLTLSVSMNYRIFLAYTCVVLLPLILLQVLQYLRGDATFGILGLAPFVFTWAFILSMGYQNFLAQRERVLSQLNLSAANTKLLEQTARTEHASKLASLGEMAGGVAHEVNNPLMIISGSVEHLRRLLTDNPEAERALPLLDRILNAEKRIAKITSSLVAFSTNAERELMAKHSVQEIIETALDLCREKFAAQKIEIFIQNEGQWEVFGAMTEFVQILMTLLNNAYDSIVSADSEDRYVILRTQEVGNNIQIFVVNSGPVISENIREKIFTPFFTTKGRGIGTGLNLSVSRGIAQQAGGSLEYMAELPNTTFCLTWPRYKRSA